MMGLRLVAHIGRPLRGAMLLTALLASGGCGQRGPLVLPGSAQPPAAPAATPQTDEDDAEPQEAERKE